MHIKDHKKAYEGDYGPNTGGMGAVAPMVVAEPMDREISEILRTTVDALRRDGLYYRGGQRFKSRKNVLF